MSPVQKVDFEKLRAERNAAVLAEAQKCADDLGASLADCAFNYDPNACYCACPDGPCEHTWNGPEWRAPDGCGCSVTCSRCGTTAMSHDIRVLP